MKKKLENKTQKINVNRRKWIVMREPGVADSNQPLNEYANRNSHHPIRHFFRAWQ